MRIMRFLMVPVAALGLALSACTAEVEEEGKAPDVDVQGGELPKVDVEPADVDVNVGRDTQTVVTPDVDVTTTPADTGR